MGLFDNPSSGAPASGTPAPKPLFGNASSTTTPSLFSQGASSTPVAPLFGTGAAKTMAPPFGATPASSQPGATSTPFSSLFQSTTAAQPTTTNPPLNTQQTSAGQPSAFPQSSLFSSSTAPPQQQADGPLSQSTANGTTRSAHFDHLLERGRKRNAAENAFGTFDELPSLQLGLGDIARKVRNLGAGGPSADQAQNSNAHFLLSASGVKLSSTLRDLNQFSTQAGLSTTGPAATSILDNDVDGYISNLHSQSTLSLIQEGLEQSKRDFDLFLEENVQIEWDAQRKRIYDHFGLGRQSEEMAASQRTFGGSTARGAFGRSTRRGRATAARGDASVNGSSFGASGAPPVLGSVLSPSQKGTRNGLDYPDISGAAGPGGPPSRSIREKQERFMDKVKELNETRLREAPYPVFHGFKTVETASNEDNQEHILNAYDALISITGESENTQAFTSLARPKARSFAKDYLSITADSPESVRIRKRIVNGSRKYLEERFLRDVEEALLRHAKVAEVGGVPGRAERIRGYVRVKVEQRELGKIEELQRFGPEGHEYPWVIIFFFLRGGLTGEAAEYVRERRNFFQNNDRNFIAAVQHYHEDPDHRLTLELQQKINQTFAQRARISPTNDPYRMACYKIIGRCEITRRNLEPLPQSMDDWIWLQFNLAREVSRAEENAGEAFGLEELRASIEDIGKRHFTTNAEAAGGYGVYFYLATLGGMFEHAVDYLYQHNYMSAIHIAIALDYYGLLRVSNWSEAGLQMLTYTTRQQPQLNFGRIVGHYTADFRAARADAAAEYLILICLNADLEGQSGRDQASLCHEALRELVLETNEFVTLLGDVKTNGQATPGLIQQRLPLIKLADEEALVDKIIQEAAKTADDNGRTNDAVLLCHIAGEYDSVVRLLNRALSEALSVDLGQEPLRLEPLRQGVARGPQTQLPTLDSSSTLSMLATDDPIELAGRVMTLYDQNALWWQNVARVNRDALGVLSSLNAAKKTVEAGRYMEALDQIQSLDILPLKASGNLSMVRATANNFSGFLPEIARNIGNVLLWCIMCCSRHREILLSGQFEDPTRRALADQLLQKAKDLMVFAGLIRYKLPPRVFETLAREGQDVGAY